MPTEKPESAEPPILSIFSKNENYSNTRKSFQYPGAMNVTLQTIMAVGINEKLDVIQAVIIAAAKEEESKREQRRFMSKHPVVAPC